MMNVLELQVYIIADRRHEQRTVAKALGGITLSFRDNDIGYLI